MTKPDAALQMLEGAREQRSVATLDFEMRAKTGSANLLHFTGYAALFDSSAQVNSGPMGPFEESLMYRSERDNAFSKTLSRDPDVVLRTEHKNLPIARTTAGNLHLSTDSKGLHVSADLDRRDSDVAQLEVKMENRNLSQMSYVFRATRAKWSDDYSKRELLEVNIDKGDVSIVTYGANEKTTSRMSSLAEVTEAIRSIDLDEMVAEARSIDSREALQEARDQLDRLLRKVAPPAKRTMSLAEAEALIAGR